MKNSQITFWAIMNSLGIFAYVSLVAFVFFNLSRFADKTDNFTDPILFLLLFVVSAVITSSLFFGRPILWYLDGQKKEAVKLFLYTLISLIVILFVFLSVKILLFI